MTPDAFTGLVERLTGTPPKEITTNDLQDLEVALHDEARRIDHSQFNELLLIVNKDRVSEPFFRFFFSTSTAEEPPSCTVDELRRGVEEFQRTALLCFGNFIYAFRSLSRARSRAEICSKLGVLCSRPEDMEQSLRKRQPPILSVKPISRDDTYLIGYLSTAEILAEHHRAKFLLQAIPENHRISWSELDSALEDIGAGHKEPTKQLVSVLRQRLEREASPQDLRQLLNEEFVQLDELAQRVERTHLVGDRNTDVYLTWDHMDVYFATSMRKRWEYEDLYDFVNALMARPELAELNIRYFDPTQSFDKNRINKGLVEALMLKRATCTVYSVQDTDTLGKDSELAATLAQGKPVIAYAPQIDVNERVQQLGLQRPRALKERLQFIFYADESFGATFTADMEFIQSFSAALDAFEANMPWRALTDASASQQFRSAHGADLTRFCRVIALSEQRIYNKRADTMLKAHPLALQVNLDTGVANGVLVVRDIPTCAVLVRRILTNSMEFEVRNDPDTNSWLLVERLTNSIFRVVTRDRKLTNCFWNFYRKDSFVGEQHA